MANLPRLGISVGGMAIGETGIQQTSPAAATSGTASAAFTPAFTQAGTVETATLSYSFNYGDTIASETATQDTDPMPRRTHDTSH